MNTRVEKYRNREPVNDRDGFLRLNPNKSEIMSLIEETKRMGGKVLMEIGPGKIGGVSLEKDDLYIGVEPYFEGELSFAVNKAELGARVAVVTDVYQLPKFKPDLFLSIAPNPNDIENGMLFDYEPYIVGAGVVVLALDTRTREANSGSGIRGFVRKVECDLKEMGRREMGMEVVSGSISELLEDLGLERNCNLNSSADLGGRAVVVFSER